MKKKYYLLYNPKFVKKFPYIIENPKNVENSNHWWNEKILYKLIL